MLGKSTIEVLVNLVEDEIKQVETRNERRWQVDVTGYGPIDIVLGSNRVGGR